MNERDLRAVAETYGKIVTSRDRLSAQHRPNALLSTISETVRFANLITGVPRAFREELRFEYDEGALGGELFWLNTKLRLVVHEEPHWIFPEDYDLEPVYHDFACTRLVVWEPAGDTENVAGEVQFYDNGEVLLTGCFGDQMAETLTDLNQVVDVLFEWMVKEFRPRKERIDEY